jgi:hypothetical protein
MKYILMMHGSKKDWDNMAGIGKWPKEDIHRHMAFLMDLNKQLKASGELVGVKGLYSPTQAKIVRAGKNGEPITDGVFPETKEFLAGYWMVDVESPERAYAIAAQASLAPGPGNVPMHMAIEVRQVMGGPPEEFA